MDGKEFRTFRTKILMRMELILEPREVWLASSFETNRRIPYKTHYIEFVHKFI